MSPPQLCSKARRLYTSIEVLCGSDNESEPDGEDENEEEEEGVEEEPFEQPTVAGEDNTPVNIRICGVDELLAAVTTVRSSWQKSNLSVNIFFH